MYTLDTQVPSDFDLPFINERITMHSDAHVGPTELTIGRFLDLLNRRDDSFFKTKSVLLYDDGNGYLGIVSAILGADVLVLTGEHHLRIVQTNVDANRHLINKHDGRITVLYSENQLVGKYDLILLNEFVEQEDEALGNLITRSCRDKGILLTADKEYYYCDDENDQKIREWLIRLGLRLNTRKGVNIRERPITFSDEARVVDYFENEYEYEDLSFIKDYQMDLLWYVKLHAAYEDPGVENNKNSSTKKNLVENVPLPLLDEKIAMHNFDDRFLIARDIEVTIGRFLVLLNRRNGSSYFKKKSVLVYDVDYGYLGIVSAILGADVLLVTEDYLPDIQANIELNRKLINKHGGRITVANSGCICLAKFDLILIPEFSEIKYRDDLVVNIITKNCHDGTIILTTDNDFYFFNNEYAQESKEWLNQLRFKLDTHKCIRIKNHHLRSHKAIPDVDYYENEYEDREIGFIKDQNIDLLWYFKEPAAIEAMEIDDVEEKNDF